MNIRALTAAIFARLLSQKQHLGDLFSQKTVRELPPQDKKWLKACCYGMARSYFENEAIIQLLVPKKIKDPQYEIQSLLHLGLFQLKSLSTPDHAAIGETVNATDALKKTWAKGFINGTLRNFLRNKEALLKKAKDTPQGKTNHPIWLLEKMKKAWPAHVDAIVAANQSAAPMVLRVNLHNTSLVHYQSLLNEKGIGSDPIANFPAALQLKTPVDVTDLPHFDAGWVTVQDLAAQLAAPLLLSTPGHLFLDACSSPGGKLSHLLEQIDEKGKIVALEKSKKRFLRLKKNVARFGDQLPIAFKCVDANQLERWWDGQWFDGILLDAPCSGTGVIRRNPDILLMRQPADLPLLVNAQKALLETCWKILKPGGRLLYATCSILPEENEKQMEAFIKAHPDGTALPIQLPFSFCLTTTYGTQLLPLHGKIVDPVDGFYYCLLEKQ